MKTLRRRGVQGEAGEDSLEESRETIEDEPTGTPSPPSPPPSPPSPLSLFSSITKIQHNWIKRVIFGAILITGFLLLILMGPMVLILLAVMIQLFCFNEIIQLGYKYINIPDLPYFRAICWYFVGVANYFFCGEIFRDQFQAIYQNHPFLQMLVFSHRFISFCIYFCGLVWFVMSLVRKYDMRQFQILAWTHFLLIIIVLQAYFAVSTIFQGLIWVILPASLVILNDIFAYVFGRLYGKTPLIKLSPNKTREGFIGGALGSLVAGFILAQIMCRYKYFTCPIEYVETDSGWIALNSNCTSEYLFHPEEYQINSFISINVYPFNWHFFPIWAFASLIAPFGGFCASGFKRACKVKNFSESIPGHGGIMDRFDCQYLMATFVMVYIHSFVGRPTVEKIFRHVLYHDETSQLEFLRLLESSLVSQGLLNVNNTVF